MAEKTEKKPVTKRKQQRVVTPEIKKPLKRALKAYRLLREGKRKREQEGTWGVPVNTPYSKAPKRIVLDQYRERLAQWKTHYYNGEGVLFLCLGPSPSDSAPSIAVEHYLSKFPQTYLRGADFVQVDANGKIRTLKRTAVIEQLNTCVQVIRYRVASKLPPPEVMRELYNQQVADPDFLQSPRLPAGEPKELLLISGSQVLPPHIRNLFLATLARTVKQLIQTTTLGLIPNGGGFEVAYKPGYEPGSMVYVNSDLPDLRELSQAFTPKTALSLINKVLSAWSFATKTDKLNALESQFAYMTKSLGVIHPVTMINALEIQSGKTHLGRLAHVALTGVAPPQPVYPDFNGNNSLAAAEFNAAAVEEPASILLDNISEDTVIGGSYLEALITATAPLNPHVLGRGNVAYMPLNILFLFTGNRIQMSPDMRRRARIIDIRRRTVLTGGAAASKGSFVDRMQQNPKYRLLYVSALLRLVQYWVDSGCPGAPKSDRNFPIDSQVTGGITALAASIGGREDFVRDNWKTSVYLSPWEQEMKILVAKWPKNKKGRPAALGVKDIYELADELNLFALYERMTGSGTKSSKRPHAYLSRNMSKFPALIYAGSRSNLKHYRPAPPVELIGDRLKKLKWIREPTTKGKGVQWSWVAKSLHRIQKEIGPISSKQMPELQQKLKVVGDKYVCPTVCPAPDWREIVRLWPQQQTENGLEHQTIRMDVFLSKQGWSKFPKPLWVDVDSYEDSATGKIRICPNTEPIEYL